MVETARVIWWGILPSVTAAAKRSDVTDVMVWKVGNSVLVLWREWSRVGVWDGVILVYALSKNTRQRVRKV